MRILQIVRHLDVVGGIQTYVAGLTAHLADLGHESVILSGDGGRCEGASTTGCVPTLTGELNRREDAQSLVKTIRQHQPDVILVHTAPGATILQAAKATGLPTTAFVHTFACSVGKVFRRSDTICTHPINPRCYVDWYVGPCGSSPSPITLFKSHRQGLAYVDALRSVDGVFVATNYMKQYITGEGVDPSKIVVEPWAPGLGPAQVTPDQLRLDYAGDHRKPGNIAFVGRLTYDKGVHHLISAMRFLGPQFRLRIVGDGWYRKTLVDQVTAFGLTDRIEFAGEKSGMALISEFERANVVVVPSVIPEPWGLVVGEACAAGAAVVVSNAGGLPEWQQWSDRVMTCHSGKPEHLADAIRTSNSANAGRKSEAARTDPKLPNLPERLVGRLQVLAFPPSPEVVPGGAA